MATILARINPSLNGAMLMMAATAPTTDTVQYRKNIRNLTADELAALRDTVERLVPHLTSPSHIERILGINQSS